MKVTKTKKNSSNKYGIISSLKSTKLNFNCKIIFYLGVLFLEVILFLRKIYT